MINQFKTAFSNIRHKRNNSNSKFESPFRKSEAPQKQEQPAGRTMAFLSAPRMPSSWRNRSKTTVMKQKAVA